MKEQEKKQLAKDFKKKKEAEVLLN